MPASGENKFCFWKAAGLFYLFFFLHIYQSYSTHNKLKCRCLPAVVLVLQTQGPALWFGPDPQTLPGPWWAAPTMWWAARRSLEPSAAVPGPAVKHTQPLQVHFFGASRATRPRWAQTLVIPGMRILQLPPTFIYINLKAQDYSWCSHRIDLHRHL